MTTENETSGRSLTRRRLNGKTTNEETPPTLGQLAEDPTRVGALPPDLAINFLTQCLTLQVALVGHLLASWPRSGKAADDRLLTMQEVAETLSVPETYAYELARRRDLPAVKLGKYVRVRAADFEAWLNALYPPATGRPGSITEEPSPPIVVTHRPSLPLKHLAARIERRHQPRQGPRK
jgi:excisionase family DNA binding protein